MEISEKLSDVITEFPAMPFSFCSAERDERWSLNIDFLIETEKILAAFINLIG